MVLQKKWYFADLSCDKKNILLTVLPGHVICCCAANILETGLTKDWEDISSQWSWCSIPDSTDLLLKFFREQFLVCATHWKPNVGKRKIDFKKVQDKAVSVRGLFIGSFLASHRDLCNNTKGLFKLKELFIFKKVELMAGYNFGSAENIESTLSEYSWVSGTRTLLLIYLKNTGMI